MNRPTSVTVFGVLGIVLGALGILGAFVALVALAHMPAGPTRDAMEASATFAAWLNISQGLDIVGSVALLVAGIGLLKLRPWARLLTVAWGVYNLALVAISTGMTYIYVTKSGAPLGLVVGVLWSMVLSLLFIAFMYRKPVVDALNPAANVGETFAGQAGSTPWEKLAEEERKAREATGRMPGSGGDDG